MEERDPSTKIDNPETISPSTGSPAVDVNNETGSAVGNSPKSGAKRPARAQRLAEAFREGVDSTKKDYVKRPDDVIPPRAKNIRQESDESGMLDRVIREGISAVADAGDKAANAVDAVIQLVKKAPAMTQKYAEAFRDGAASVKPRSSKERREEGPAAAKKKEAPADGGSIQERVLQAGGSAADFIRKAVSVMKPGEVGTIRQKIRLATKKINSLYIDIGAEAVNSFRSGMVETEKLSALLDSLRQNEAEILTMQAQLAEITFASKKAAVVRTQTTETEAPYAPLTDLKVGPVDAGVTGVKPGESPVDNSVGGQPENRSDVVSAPAGADLSVSVTANSGQEESDSEAEPALPEEPEAKQEKNDEREKSNNG